MRDLIMNLPSNLVSDLWNLNMPLHNKYVHISLMYEPCHAIPNWLRTQDIANFTKTPSFGYRSGSL